MFFNRFSMSAQLLYKKGLLTVFFWLSGFFLIAQSKKIDSLEVKVREQVDTVKVNTLIQLSGELSNYDIETALKAARQAYAYAQKTEEPISQIKSLYQLGDVYSDKRDDTLAVKSYLTGISKAKKIKNDFLITKGYIQLGFHYQSANDVRRSIEYLDQALEIALQNKFQELLAKAYQILGLNYDKLSLYETALTYYFKSLHIHEALKDKTQIAADYNGIGFVYQHTADFENALPYFTKAIALNTELGNQKGEMISLLNKGVIYQKIGDFNKALTYYHQSLSRARILNNKSVEAISLGNIGSTKVSQGQLEDGLAYLENARAIKEENHYIRSLLHTLNDIADVKIMLNDAKAAQEISEQVVNLSKEYEDGYQLEGAYLNLSKAYKAMGNFEEAYVFLEKYNNVNDSLFGIEKAQKINQLEIQYKTQKKDQAIASLQKEKEIAGFRTKIYILLAAIVLIIIVFLYISQRQKARRNKALLEKEKEVDRLKSSFFANISHEFRTPLTLILGPIETMLDQTDDPDQKNHLHTIKKSAARLLRLINQILDLSKLESGHLTLKTERGNIVPVLRGVTGSFQSLADSKNINLTFQADHEDISLYFDQNQVETILINLVSNAFKFTPHAGVITVKARQLITMQEEPELLEVSVSDSGAGISKEQVSHIFDRFYQAGHASDSYFGGTGIGLALTKELVELHEGTISVQSEVGKGTTVTFTLPFAGGPTAEVTGIKDAPQARVYPDYTTAIEEELALHIAGEDTEDPDETDIQKPILLLIEDNVDVRNYVRGILSPYYALIEAPNGEEGIKKAIEYIPDLVISDVMMPLKNGYEVCKFLKQEEKTAHIPVILLTAKASVNSRIEGLETEADLYLSKPFVPKELMLCIRNLIESRKKLRERYNKQVVLKPKDIAVNSVDEQFLEKLMRVVETNFEDEAFTVDQLGKEIGMSRSQLHRKLQALTNESSSQFIRSFRLQRAMELLRKKNASIAEIAFKVGFGSPSYFNKCFLKHYGCTPSEVVAKTAVP